MATTSNFGWTTPDDTALVKDGAAAIRTLGNSIDTSFVDLKGGTTGQVLTKASNTDLDYSWTSVDPLTILDAKGDLISATAADTPARLPVGTNGQVLKANSSTSTGLEWGSVSATKSFSLISTTNLSGSSTVTITGLSGYDVLQIVIFDAGTNSTAGPTISLRLNTDTGTNYRRAGALLVPAGVVQTAGDSDSFPLGIEGTTAGNDLDGTITILGANATGPKMVNLIFGPNGSGSGGYAYGGAYLGTSVISSISVITSAGSFDEGTVYIYGAQ